MKYWYLYWRSRICETVCQNSQTQTRKHCAQLWIIVIVKHSFLNLQLQIITAATTCKDYVSTVQLHSRGFKKRARGLTWSHAALSIQRFKTTSPFPISHARLVVQSKHYAECEVKSHQFSILQIHIPYIRPSLGGRGRQSSLQHALRAPCTQGPSRPPSVPARGLRYDRAGIATVS